MHVILLLIVMQLSDYVGFHVLTGLWLQALSELHDRIPPFPQPEAMKIIEEELGAPVESFFSHFSQETVAAASFGQVSTLVFILQKVSIIWINM